jgi:hypothetical protein
MKTNLYFYYRAINIKDRAKDEWCCSDCRAYHPGYDFGGLGRSHLKRYTFRRLLKKNYYNPPPTAAREDK